MIPTTEPAQRIAKLFNRKLTTNWSEREVRQYKILYKAGAFKDLGDLTLLERYHLSEKKKGDKGIHRRDLYTFIYNWTGELDRARAWEERKGGFKLKYESLPRPKELSDEQIEKNKEVIATELKKLRERFKLPEVERKKLPPIVEEALTVFRGTLA